ncbi:peroxide stress protein YaaA [Actinomadura sp. ATCC 31491]|uniref:Peroxide stress protein YaaA n=1 Tax=Actinomadura luzonensis TaxID=2805427 RepID=A0ABT0FZJ4_9ACTN|nr:peroxide stress protein YaaA [Actinomadura luzonensis]MCK2217735.1 peroxide stress protein YaaA [Actinomadura luzonensis]
MLILLPPSEGKAPEGSGPPVGELSFPALGRARKRVMSALVRASRRRDALDVLGLTPGLAGELAKNAELKTAGTLPAAELYTGVLYDNLGLGTLDGEARERAEASVLIFSGLWGVVRITDLIPPYRLSMGVNLPPLGGLAAFWRPVLAKALDPVPGLVVDLRSATYAGAWQPGERSVTVRVFRDGKVVSHMAKATRGEIARALLLHGAAPSAPDELAKLLADLGYTVELTPPPRPGRPWALDVHLTEDTPGPA